jgi:predicted ArsR family transcriptional regulator
MPVVLIDLKPTSQLLLQALIETPISERTNLPIAKLADRIGVHENTVRLHIRNLKALKLISVRRGNGLGRSYTFMVERRGYFFTNGGSV